MRETVCALALLGCMLVGCQKLAERAAKPTPADLVNQLKSDDPDLRRDAVERLSREKWGREGSFPKAYALMTRDDDHTVRSAALRALGGCGNTDYVKDVIAGLEDAAPSVRCDAACALGSLIHAAAIVPLSRSASSDPSAQVRIVAVRALGQYPRADVLEILLGRLSDREVAVRHQAAESLATLTGEDGGDDPERWADILSAKKDPFKRPSDDDEATTAPGP